MGMFDKPPKLADDFPPDSGKCFNLLDASFLGYDDSFGSPNASAGVTVFAEGKTIKYRIYGKMAEQVARLDEGDLPASVRLVKQGRANIIELVEKLDPNQATNQDVPF